MQVGASRPYHVLAEQVAPRRQPASYTGQPRLLQDTPGRWITPMDVIFSLQLTTGSSTQEHPVLNDDEPGNKCVSMLLNRWNPGQASLVYSHHGIEPGLKLVTSTPDSGSCPAFLIKVTSCASVFHQVPSPRTMN